MLLPSGPEAALSVFPDIPAPKPDLPGFRHIQPREATDRGHGALSPLNMFAIPLPGRHSRPDLRARAEPVGIPHRLADMPYQCDRELKCRRAIFLKPVIEPSFGLAAALALPRT